MMTNMLSRAGLLFLFLLPPHRVCGQDLTAAQVLARIDRNYLSDTRVSTTTMVIKGRRGSRTITARSWGRGLDQAFTEYLSPARERGTKMLKLGDELWMYAPDADRVIRIAGHMLRQSMSGSDISYEDFMEDPHLENSYRAEMAGQDTAAGRQCWVLSLTAKNEKVAYTTRKLWVDKERFLPLRENLYAKSGKLLKTLSILETTRVGERWYPRRMVFKDVLKEGDGTEMVIDSIEFNVAIPEYLFSKAALRQ
jgi:outer membrane lipoprotein-sorting protein